MDENPINQLKKIERDENGLIKGLNYIYNSNGKVDWKSMIPREFLYINPDPKKRAKIESDYRKSYEELDPIKDDIKDSDLVILLNGLRHLLNIRGHNYVKLTPLESREDYASVNCQISFIPNFEEEGRSVYHEDNACAHPRNTSNFAQNYLLEIASNRAFCRCLRSYLKIGIVSREELGASLIEPPQDNGLPDLNQISRLTDLMESKRVTWAHLKERMKLDACYDEAWTSIEKLPKDIIFRYIERLKKKSETPKEKVAEPVKIETT